MSDQSNNTSVLQDEKTKENKFTLKNITEWLGFLAAMIAFLSILSSVIIRYISFGRCLYFDFDLDYYDFSLTNTSKFIFVISIIACIVSALLSLLIDMIWKGIVTHTKGVKSKFLIGIILFISTCALIIVLSKFFIIEKSLYKLFSFMTFTFTIIIFPIINELQTNNKNSKRISNVVIASIVLIAFIVPLCMSNEYDNAKNQNTFKIITDKVDKQSNYYVVISEGKEKYSTYLCDIQYKNGKNIIKIFTDKHKYFKINDTEFNTVKFEEMQRYETKSLTAKSFLSINK